MHWLTMYCSKLTGVSKNSGDYKIYWWASKPLLQCSPLANSLHVTNLQYFFGKNVIVLIGNLRISVVLQI